MARKPRNDDDIVNAQKLLRVDITQKDISKGRVMEPDACAAAQAILRSTNATEVEVHRGVTYVKLAGRWHRYVTSAGLRMETIVFDRGGKFMPGEYDLRPVPVSMLVKTPRKPSPSKGKTPREAAASQKRRVIPGVRRMARRGGPASKEE